MDDDRRRWDARHADAPDPVPVAPDRFDDFVHRLPSQGRALDVACGTGAQALWAAQRGLRVDAVDVSSVAIERLRRAARALGVADRIDARVADLHDGWPSDLTGPYDLVICQRYLDRGLLVRVGELLAPGGLAVITVLSRVGHDGDPGRFRVAPGELTDLLADAVTSARLRTCASVEADGTATVVLERPMDAAATAGDASPDLELLDPRVAAAVVRHRLAVDVVPCDPAAADTAAFCDRYGYALEDSANTIVVVGKAAEPAFAACVVLASTRLAVNSVVKRRLGTRKASFASGETTREITGMEIGGVTAIGLPAELPVWVDAAVMARRSIILGGGNRSSKLLLDPHELARVPGAAVVEGLATSPDA